MASSRQYLSAWILARRHAEASVVEMYDDLGLTSDLGQVWPCRHAGRAEHRRPGDADRLLSYLSTRDPAGLSPALRGHRFILRAARQALDGSVDPVEVELGFHLGIETFDAYGSPPGRS